MALTDEQIERFESYRAEAMRRLGIKEHRHRIGLLDWQILCSIMSDYDIPPGMERQIRRDLRVYLFYDALAMWLDPNAGLVHYGCEEMFERIGVAFCGHYQPALSEPGDVT